MNTVEIALPWETVPLEHHQIQGQIDRAQVIYSWMGVAISSSSLVAELGLEYVSRWYVNQKFGGRMTVSVRRHLETVASPEFILEPGIRSSIKKAIAEMKAALK